MTYLAVNKNIIDERPKVISVNESAGETVNEILPRQVLDDMIDAFSYHFLMDACICRTGFQCKNFTSEVGCLFMGETARKLPPGLGGQVSREQAHAHVDKAVRLGLIPMTGKVNVDNLGFLIKDTKELFSVCFCCHCCCMMGYYKHSPEHLKKLFIPNGRPARPGQPDTARDAKRAWKRAFSTASSSKTALPFIWITAWDAAGAPPHARTARWRSPSTTPIMWKT
jgi:hypothetical protein